MQGTKPVSLSGSESVGTCRILLVYEDAAARQRALELQRRLLSEVSDGLDFILDSLNFAKLAEPASSHDAVQAAASADIIVIATHGNDLPSAVCVWLDACVRARSRTEGALVLLLAEPFMLSASSGESVELLKRTADLLKMDFLTLMPPPVQAIMASLQRRSAPTSARPHTPFDRPASHWGLNE